MATTENTTPIVRWRARMGLSQRAAAHALGVVLLTYQQYERGATFAGNRPRPVPLAVLLACAAIEHGIEPIK